MSEHMKQVEVGDTVFCKYTNWRGETGYRFFICLDKIIASNQYYKEEQELYVGYDVQKSAIRTFAKCNIEDEKIAKPHESRVVECYTNWITVGEDGSFSFNHQAPFKDKGKSPTIIDNKYGLQSRWDSMKWIKEYLYYINGEYIGKVGI